MTPLILASSMAAAVQPAADFVPRPDRVYNFRVDFSKTTHDDIRPTVPNRAITISGSVNMKVTGKWAGYAEMPDLRGYDWFFDFSDFKMSASYEGFSWGPNDFSVMRAENIHRVYEREKDPSFTIPPVFLYVTGRAIDTNNNILRMGGEGSTIARGLDPALPTVFFNSANFFTPTSITALPEPSSWALMFVGFGLAGMALRRGRAQRSMIVTR